MPSNSDTVATEILWEFCQKLNALQFSEGFIVHMERQFAFKRLPKDSKEISFKLQNNDNE